MKGIRNMTICSFPAVLPTVPKLSLYKTVAFAAGLGLSMLSYPIHATPASGGDTVQGLYDALLNTMKNGRILGQSGRFTQLEPVIRRSFDITSMARPSGGAASASDRELRALYVGNLC
jgi:hypothetical protein